MDVFEPDESFHVATSLIAKPVPCYLFRPADNPSRIALVLHGRDGAVAQPQIQTLLKAYLNRGWTVAAADLPYSRASPELGAAEEVTMERHALASATVLDALLQRVGQVGTVALCGHSLGAYAAAVIADKAADLHHLLAVSPVLSGQALLDARAAMGPAALEALAREAPHMHATMDAVTAAPALRELAAPVAVLTGDLDGLTPPAAARDYLFAAQNAAFFAVLPDQHHCPAGPATDRALAAALDAVGA